MTLDERIAALEVLTLGPEVPPQPRMTRKELHALFILTGYATDDEFATEHGANVLGPFIDEECRRHGFVSRIEAHLHFLKHPERGSTEEPE